MSIESIDCPTRLRAHARLQGVTLTDDELFKLGGAERQYPRSVTQRGQVVAGCGWSAQLHRIPAASGALGNT
jgi:hypothetical protein